MQHATINQPSGRAARFRLPRPTGFIQACFRDYGEQQGIEPFVILFLPRTGSNFLASILDSHPDILCHHEIFNHRLPQCSQTVRSGEVALSLGTATERDHDPWSFLEKVFSETGTNKDGQRHVVKLIGAKVSPYDNFWVLLSVLLNRRIRKIVVRRSNFLAAFVSGQLAMSTGQWAVFKNSTEAVKPTQKVHVDVHRFRAYARKRRLFHAAIRLIMNVTRQRYSEVEYVRLKDATVRGQVLRFLGVSTESALSERTQKQERGPLEERISNFDELQRMLSGTSYCRMLQGE